MKKNIKHLTLLHSNDMHGDFLAEQLNQELVGGLSLLSGYVNKTRKEEKNVLYMVAGDMFRGSLIDTEFQGVSTIEIMNLLGPDVVSLGNHELDYGIAHLLFLEKCCKFPIVNSNIYIKSTGMRLFDAHKIITIDGMKILVMGLLTEEIMNKAKNDMLLGTFVDLNDAAKEVGIICNSYKDVDIDFTILLTHIGFSEDIELAKKINPAWGVDVIIGGHSHTLLSKPEKVNDILIVQAGIGTNQIGRFEIDIDTDKNAIDNYTWKTVSIDATHCPKNNEIADLINNYKRITDERYGLILTNLVTAATHPSRYQETTVGNLFCDALHSQYQLDIVMLGSGSLRADHLGPIITNGNLLEMYPYDESLKKIELTGKQLKDGMTQVMRNSVGTPGSDKEYYQFSKGVHIVYSLDKAQIMEFTYNNKPIKDDDCFTVAMEGYHLANLNKFLGVSLSDNIIPKTITQNIRTSVEEFLKMQTHLYPKIEKRTVII